MGNRIVVLLGAGASVDAGLPVTEQLSENAVTHFNDEVSWQRELPGWLKALNFVYGQMVGHQSRDGENPRKAVNIEHLISALRLLSDRETHEAAPFVASWLPGAEGFPDSHWRSASGKLIDSLDEGFRAGFRSTGAGRKFAKELEAYLDARDVVSSGVFQEAEQKLLTYLVSVLSGHTHVRYLQPLAQLAKRQGGLDVLTLNYDRTVEAMAEGRRIRVDTAIDSWSPGRPMTFDSHHKGINLIKLHGSVDWVIDRSRNSAESPTVRLKKNGRFADPSDPWVVVGDREKLGTGGPILQLLRAAEAAMARADTLVVVGYSFSDHHVNALISDWMQADPRRSLRIVDPGWQPARGFTGDLVELYGVKGGSISNSRLRVVAKTAEAGLPEALQDKLRVEPKWAGVSVQPTLIPGRVEFTLEYPSVLTKVAVELGTALDKYPPNPAKEGLVPPRVVPEASDMEIIYRPTAGDTHIGFDTWREGETLTVEVEPELLESGELKVRVEGWRPDSYHPDSSLTEVYPF